MSDESVVMHYLAGYLVCVRLNAGPLPVGWVIHRNIGFWMQDPF